MNIYEAVLKQDQIVLGLKVMLSKSLRERTSLEVIGWEGRTRTPGIRIQNPTFFQLNYLPSGE